MKLKNIINKKIKEIEKNKIDGIFSQKDFLSPSYINLTNPKYIEFNYYKLLS